MNLTNLPIELTEEEIESINNYLNAWHAQINTMCNLTPNVQQKLIQKGTTSLFSAKASYKKDGLSDEEVAQKLFNDFQKLLNDFVNVYSAMQKLNHRTPTGRLFRGTSNDLVEIHNSFISTSFYRPIAITFKTYISGGALIEYKLADNVPVIDMEALAEQYAMRIYNNYIAGNENAKLYITGHSLGGYLAQIGAAKLINTGNWLCLKKVVYFNGMGIEMETVNQSLLTFAS